jgi:hypothetical protein
MSVKSKSILSSAGLIGRLERGEDNARRPPYCAIDWEVLCKPPIPLRRRCSFFRMLRQVVFDFAAQRLSVALIVRFDLLCLIQSLTTILRPAEKKGKPSRTRGRAARSPRTEPSLLKPVHS